MYTEVQLYQTEKTELEIFYLSAPNAAAASYSPNKTECPRCHRVGRRAELRCRQAERRWCKQGVGVTQSDGGGHGDGLSEGWAQ